MQNITLRTNKLAILYPFVFFAATNMLIRAWVPFFYGSWRTLLIGCLLSIIVVQQFLRTRWFLWIALYSLVIVINWYSGDMFFNSPEMVANEIANLFLFSSATFYLFCSKDNRCAEWTYWTILLLVGVAAIGSLLVNEISPEIVRNQSLLVEQGEQNVLYGYYRMGLSNYLLPHGIPAIIPPLIFLISQNRYNKWVCFSAIIFLVLSLILVYLGGSTTVLLLSLVGLVSFFIKGKSRKDYGIVIVSFLLMLPFIFFPDLVSNMIGLFSGEISDTYISHLQDLADYSTERQLGNTASRMGLYGMSFNEFMESPIWGTNNPMSQHSVLLDRLGSLGLLGMIPFVGIMVSFIRFVRLRLRGIEKTYFDLTVLLMLILLLVKGIGEKEIWLMFFVASPIILCVYSLFKAKLNSNR